jgi:hypothetical protein
MVVVPFLRNNPSAVMFFQRFIFPTKTLWENIRSASGFFIAGNRDHLTKGAISFSFHVTDFIKQ